jgi:hypothetical protein
MSATSASDAAVNAVDDREVSRVDAMARRQGQDDRAVPGLLENQAHRGAEHDRDTDCCQEPRRARRRWGAGKHLAWRWLSCDSSTLGAVGQASVAAGERSPAGDTP